MKQKLCELAVDGKPCLYGNGQQLFICCVHRLNAAKRLFLQSFTVVADEFEDYVCPLYEKAGDDVDETMDPVLDGR